MSAVEITDAARRLIEAAARLAAAGEDLAAMTKAMQAIEGESYIKNLRLPPDEIRRTLALVWAALDAQRAADRSVAS
jgi:hypothetical protein